jgi:hypothetical protein
MKLIWFAALLIGILMGAASCDNKQSRIQYCTYIAGGDCECYRPPIASTDIICLPCDSNQTDCPNIVRLSIYCPPRGGRRDTCRITATRQSAQCINCPSNGKKLNKGDYTAVAVPN